ncbi:glutamyl aminopeptidase-like [Polyodon spathula]|uniref:glutamyl aminopeptidase-like n=1 Tax=Polyodon spathula TaxID=7913 RepID=UPI001B7ED3B8|nr:glutamyl aminopeptidase-like [Polyodon spathula]
MQGMDYENVKSEYCMRGKYVAIICAVVVVAALAVGLGVGLSKSEASKAPEEPPSTPKPTSGPDRPVDRGPCTSSNSDGVWNNFRLPDYVIPVHYDLELAPNLDNDIYIGSTTITINIKQATKHLWLHIRETFVTEIPKLQKKSGSTQQDVAVFSCFEYKAQEYVVVELKESLQPTENDEHYLLTLEFQGRLNGSLVGFYKTTYMEKGVLKKIAATDHEPTDARKSFPCFDEPNKKATYKISIIHDKDYNALSNMPVESNVILPDGSVKTAFQKSVPMSTYLVCFAVHQFVAVGRTSAKGIPLNIYVQPEQRHTAEYAADTTKIIFDYFELYFNMNYSLPKLDKIAIPDFGTGAMENWGLITYRENNLLYDPDQSSSYNKQRVASVIAHELVHQWFGNIVTMDWWDDLWLSEGFASFFQYSGVNKAEPDWKMLDMMVINDVLPVMRDDALLSSHPIIVDVSTPAEITSVFDGISYSKGASVLRMLQDWISPEHFQTGCQNYLKDFHFKNAKTDNFWESLAKVSGKPVKEVLDTWTKQMGFPLLNVTESYSMTQKRFLLDPKADITQPPTDLGYKWTIPIRWYAVTSGENGTHIFNMSQNAITLPGYSSADGQLKVNRDHLGFYRVNYHPELWDKVAFQLSTDKGMYSIADRAGLIDDGFSLARADLLDYQHALNLTKYLTNETEYLVWQRVSSSISYVTNMLMNDNTLYNKLKSYFRDQVKPIADRLGWQDTGTHLERLLRETVLGIACLMDDRDTLNNASALFNEWLKNGKSVPVNLRLLVYRYGMKNSGDEETWNAMFEIYTNTTLAQEKDKLLNGLASVQDISLLDRFLKSIKNESIVKSQDVFTIIRYVSYNAYGNTMAWDWTRLNWDYLVNRFTINDRKLGRLISSISGTFNTELELWQMHNFFEKHPEAGAGETQRKQALETVNNNIEWVKRNKDEILRWLDTIA